MFKSVTVIPAKCDFCNRPTRYMIFKKDFWNTTFIRFVCRECAVEYNLGEFEIPHRL